jgi:hypothetical protein
LKPFVGNWCIKAYLQRLFTNKWQYEKNIKEANITVAEGVADLNDIFNMGSDKDTGNDNE